MRPLMIIGTRPEAVKMCPLYLELKKRKKFDAQLVTTGQHRELLDGALADFSVTPDIRLSVMKEGQSLFHITAAILAELEKLLPRLAPDLILIHGDTTTAFAASLAAFYLKIPTAHIEAGLRTHNCESPYPEEFNRRAIALTARYHFAPTEWAKENLLAEGIPQRSVFTVGNTATDAVRLNYRGDYKSPYFTEGERPILLTAHRRENSADFEEMFLGIGDFIKAHPEGKIIFPCHPNPTVLNLARRVLGNVKNLLITPPLSSFDFHNTLARADFAVTDSGGVQEEAAYLGIPLILMRDTTERPEALGGNIIKIGKTRESVASAMERLYSDRALYQKCAEAKCPFGDGHASEKICDIMENLEI